MAAPQAEPAATDESAAVTGPQGSLFEVLSVAFRLGVSSFGGPIAHLGYFRDEYVLRRRWLDETTFADLIALFQFLPGPTSSELGISIGILRAGKLGGLAAWLGFTLPSAIALTLFAYGLQRFNLANAPWVHGLQLVAVAVVAQAVWGMARQFLTDELRIAIAISTTIVLLFVPSSVGQVAVIVLAGLVGWRFLAPAAAGLHPHVGVPISRRFGATAWTIFFVLLIGLPFFSLFFDNSADGALTLFQGFYRSGALVFGGGHVVLPLLQAVVVPPGWMTNDVFLAGYGAAQAVPGPLFTFSAFLGAARVPMPNGVAGAAIALVAIFLPGALLVYASLPFWNLFRQHSAFQRALSGINACVVGILLAALYLTIWTQTVHEPSDFGVVLVAFALLTVWKRPPWQVVVVGAIAGAGLGWLPSSA
ncbi:MAG TPA: chromate efflux transporter [Chloroflexota bacterium]